MAGLLFVIDIIALVLVARWAYRNGGIGSDESGDGLFAIKGGSRPYAPVVKPRWERVGQDKINEEAEKPSKGSEPRWKAASPRWDGRKR